MDEELAAQLRLRAVHDEQARSVHPGDWDRVHRVDAENTAWLRRIVAVHGWPGFALVGEQGAHDAWLLAQHADHDPRFQEQALVLLTEAVERGEAPRRALAYLTDRVLVAAGRQQKYGTQYVRDADGSNLRMQPVADPDRLDERRARIGLEPAADYDRRLREHLAVSD